MTPLSFQLYKLNTPPYGLDGPFGQLPSACLAVFPPYSLCIPSLLTERDIVVEYAHYMPSPRILLPWKILVLIITYSVSFGNKCLQQAQKDEYSTPIFFSLTIHYLL